HHFRIQPIYRIRREQRRLVNQHPRLPVHADRKIRRLARRQLLLPQLQRKGIPLPFRSVHLNRRPRQHLVPTVPPPQRHLHLLPPAHRLEIHAPHIFQHPVHRRINSLPHPHLPSRQ